MTMPSRRDALVPGTRIISADRKFIGRVDTVADDRFKVSAPFAPDYWLAIERVKGRTARGDLVMDFPIGDLDEALLPGPAEE